MIDRQTVFEIHRLHHLGWPERKIARSLRLSRPTVKKYIANPNPVRPKKESDLPNSTPTEIVLKRSLSRTPMSKRRWCFNESAMMVLMVKSPSSGVI